MSWWDARQRTIEVGRRTIRYARGGEGAPLLLLHGGGPGASGLSNYVRNVDDLAKSFDVIVPDLPGYGGSTKGLGRDDPFGELAASMTGLLDALGIAKAHAVGNSLGGACALRMALDAPERVGRMVLMGPGGIDTTRSLPTPGLRALLGYYRGAGPSREKLRDFITGYLVADGSALPADMLEARYLASIDPEVVAAPPLTGPSGLKAALRMDFTRDRRLGALPHPTLILWGRDDKVNRPSGAASLARRMRRADVYLFANTGHWVQWERDDAFKIGRSATCSGSEPIFRSRSSVIRTGSVADRLRDGRVFIAGDAAHPSAAGLPGRPAARCSHQADLLGEGRVVPVQPLLVQDAVLVPVADRDHLEFEALAGRLDDLAGAICIGRVKVPFACPTTAVQAPLPIWIGWDTTRVSGAKTNCGFSSARWASNPRVICPSG